MSTGQAESEPGTEVVPAVPAEVVPAGQAPAPPAPARAVYADITRAPGERLPILPPSLRGRENMRAALALAAGQAWHRTWYHGLRSPLYLVAVLGWAVIGAARLVIRQIHWWWVLEQHTLRSQAAANGDTAAWMRLHKQAKATRHVRGLVLLGEAVALAMAATVAARYAPLWPGLVLAGRPAGHRIVGTAIVPPDCSLPTHEIISRALGALGIAQINAVLKPDKEGKVQGIRFVSDVMRDGPGWACQLDLPHGVSASDILARREALASGLRRPLSATWPAGSARGAPGPLGPVGRHARQQQAEGPGLPAGQGQVDGPVRRDPVRHRPAAARRQGAHVRDELAHRRRPRPGQDRRGLADLWMHELAGKGDLEALARICHPLLLRPG